jgi:hypothetical protein
MIICIYEPNASGFQCPLPLMHRALKRVAATVESLEIPKRGGRLSAIKAKIKRDGTSRPRAGIVRRRLGRPSSPC